MQYRDDMGLEEVSNVAQRRLLEWAAGRDSGAVDQDVDTAAVGVDLLDESGHRSLVGDVERPGLQTPRPQGIEGSGISAGREHQMAVGMQKMGGGLADAARCSRDQSDRSGLHRISAPY